MRWELWVGRSAFLVCRRSPGGRRRRGFLTKRRATSARGQEQDGDPARIVDLERPCRSALRISRRCRSGRCGLRRSGLTREFTTAVVRCRLHPARIRNARTCAKMPCSNSDAGWSSPVARWAHNPKVAGSNPAPATIDTCSERASVSGALLLCTVAPSIARDFPSGRF